jgi:hypothetical protein
MTLTVVCALMLVRLLRGPASACLECQKLWNPPS